MGKSMMSGLQVRAAGITKSFLDNYYCLSVFFLEEGGHTDFAPRNEMELGLVRFMADRIAEDRWYAYVHIIELLCLDFLNIFFFRI